ncbi:hypothetical protein ACFLTH_14905 [Bacteroidota bacterium]
MIFEELKEIFTSYYRAKIIEEDEEKVVFQLYERNVELNKEEFNKTKNNLENRLTSEETELFNQKSYEILVRDTSRFYYPREREHCVEDNVNGLKYTYGKPSDERPF